MKRYFYLKVKKITTKDIAVMGLMLSLYLVLNLIAGYSIPPFFITLNLQFIPLFVLACYTDWLRTLIVVFLAGIIAFFMPANYDSAIPLAYLFDYFIPLLLVALCSVFIPREYKQYLEKANVNLKFWDRVKFNIKRISLWILNRWIFILVIIIYSFLGFWSKTFAGVLFYGQYAPEGQGVWIYSMSVNAVNSAFDLLLYLITIPIICYTLTPLKNKIY
ncbi:energy-coupled thiamine transporter ThiT [Mesoplasma coleopterae]|uniref:energy-coupled thiamine transporter ThiT n=1 Tax=Mesoplasma coleopterae TaxID=324078 RepID=UPI000D042DD8|nr:energy-coupled thiamine transporter ThiT [Mesoplasma coleopterae]AVN62747.1 hypothetical protein CG000_00245 [Mesoplasma coleopterae]